MINHLHLVGGYLIAIVIAAAAGEIGLVLHEIFKQAQQDRRADDLTADREVNRS